MKVSLHNGLTDNMVQQPRSPFLFRGVLPYMGIEICAGPHGMVFETFWSEIGYNLCTPVLNWQCFQTRPLR